MKILTLFNPATGQVRIQPARQSPNTVLHAWLKAELLAILALLPPLATPVLDVETDRIHGTVGAGESRSHRCLIMQIRSHGLRNRFIRRKHCPNPLRMAHGRPHREPTAEEMAHDPAAEETGPAEHRDQPPTLRDARVDVFSHVIIIGHVSAPTTSDSLYHAEPFIQGLSSHPPAAQRLGQPLHHNGPCPIRFRPLAWPAEFCEPTHLFGTRLNRLAEGQSAHRDPVGVTA